MDWVKIITCLSLCRPLSSPREGHSLWLEGLFLLVIRQGKAKELDCEREVVVGEDAGCVILSCGAELGRWAWIQLGISCQAHACQLLVQAFRLTGCRRLKASPRDGSGPPWEEGTQ